MPQKYQNEYLSSISEQSEERRRELQGIDSKYVNHIIYMEEEYYRRGHYIRLFPNENSRPYLRFFKSGFIKVNEMCIEFLEKKYDYKEIKTPGVKNVKKRKSV